MHSIKFFHPQLHMPANIKNNNGLTKVDQQKQNSTNFQNQTISVTNRNFELSFKNIFHLNKHNKPVSPEIKEIVTFIKTEKHDSKGDPLFFLLRNNKNLSNKINRDHLCEELIDHIQILEYALKIIDENMAKKSSYLGFRRKK